MKQMLALIFLVLLHLSTTATYCHMKRINVTDEEIVFLQQLEKDVRTIESTIIGFLEDFRENMTTGFPDLGIPPLDPLQLQHVPINISENMIKLLGKIENLDVRHLSEFQINKMHVQIFQVKVEFDLSLDNLTAEGDYDIDGIIASWFPIYGAGHFQVSLHDLRLSGYLKLTSNEGNLSVKTLDLHITLGEIDFNFENLLEDADMNALINAMISDAGPELWTQVESLLVDSIAVPVITDFINQYLVNVSLSDLIGFHGARILSDYHNRIQALANNYLDEVFARAHFLIAEQGFDPIHLPSDGDSFSMQIFNISINGSLDLYDGKLGGLSTIHRTEDSYLEYLNKTLRLTANVGINNLKGSYTIEAKLFNLGLPVNIEITVSHLSVCLDVEVAVSELNLEVNDFKINEIGSVDLVISGIPIVDSLLSALAESIINIVKDSLTFAIQEYLKPIITDQLSEVDLGDLIQGVTYNCLL